MEKTKAEKKVCCCHHHVQIRGRGAIYGIGIFEALFYFLKYLQFYNYKN
jgi:hypothetical protein